MLVSWEYLGFGYLDPGDVLLVAGVAAILVASGALMDLRRGSPDDVHRA